MCFLPASCNRMLRNWTACLRNFFLVVGHTIILAAPGKTVIRQGFPHGRNSDSCLFPLYVPKSAVALSLCASGSLHLPSHMLSYRKPMKAIVRDAKLTIVTYHLGLTAKQIPSRILHCYVMVGHACPLTTVLGGIDVLSRSGLPHPRKGSDGSASN